MILHTHFLLHLYLISIFLYYLSLIITKSRFEKDKVSKTKKEDRRGDFLEKVYKEDLGDFAFATRTVSCFGQAVPLRQHRPRRVLSSLTDWVPYATRIPLRGQSIEWYSLTKTARGPGSKREVSYVFFVNLRQTVSSSVFFFDFANFVFLESGFCDYERQVIQKD